MWRRKGTPKHGVENNEDRKQKETREQEPMQSADMKAEGATVYGSSKPCGKKSPRNARGQRTMVAGCREIWTTGQVQTAAAMLVECTKWRRMGARATTSAHQCQVAKLGAQMKVRRHEANKTVRTEE